jgi:hypothetical protein
MAQVYDCPVLIGCLDVTELPVVVLILGKINFCVVFKAFDQHPVIRSVVCPPACPVHAACMER